ncbi:MAG: LysM peptidoglycan-binding domain-containing protein [Maricaulaceae bacterium]
MALRHTLLIAPILLALSACETAQENPNYKYSSTYGEQVPQVFAQNSRNPAHNSSQAQVAPVRYVQTAPSQTQYVTQASAVTTTSNNASAATYTRVNHECLNQERTRTLIGAGLGGSAGAFAGNKIIGGTKGTLIGAAVGGTAGYGLGDASLNCDPVQVHTQATAPVITPAYSPSATTHLASSQTYSQQTYTQASPNAGYSPSPTESAYNTDTIGTPGYEAVQASLNAEASAPSAPAVLPVQAYAPPAYNIATPAQSIVPVAVQDTQSQWPNSYSQLGGNYIVEAGDTIYSLSRNLCATVSDLKTLNGLDQNFSINAGQTLQLPASKC